MFLPKTAFFPGDVHPAVAQSLVGFGGLVSPAMMSLQMQHMHMLMTSSQHAAAAAAHGRHGAAAMTSPAFIRNLFGGRQVLAQGATSSPLDLTCSSASSGERHEQTDDVTRDASDDESEQKLVERNPEIFLFGRNRAMTSHARRSEPDVSRKRRHESHESGSPAKRENTTYDDVTPPQSPEVDPVGDD